jgi:hypothetical protein
LGNAIKTAVNTPHSKGMAQPEYAKQVAKRLSNGGFNPLLAVQKANHLPSQSKSAWLRLCLLAPLR